MPPFKEDGSVFYLLLFTGFYYVIKEECMYHTEMSNSNEPADL